jgi:hypothetical protein
MLTFLNQVGILQGGPSACKKARQNSAPDPIRWNQLGSERGLTARGPQRLSHVKDLFKEKYDSYFKFAIVRNPWHRVVSCWKNKCRPDHKTSWPESIFIKAENDTLAEFVNRIVNGEFTEGPNTWVWDSIEKKSVQRDRYVKELYDPNNINWYGDERHVLSQATQIPDDVDFIIRLENFQEGLDIVCDKIGVRREEVPCRNQTKPYSYTECYDDKTRQIVAEKYKEDIERFKYKFGE